MPDLINPDRCNRTEIARVFGVDVTTVDRWRRDGLPHAVDGRALQFSIFDVHKWLIARHCADRQDDNPMPLDPVYEAARLSRARADAQELTNREREGELVEARSVVEGWTQIVMYVRAALINLGSRLAPELVGLSGERQIKRRIDDETHMILSDLSHESG